MAPWKTVQVEVQVQVQVRVQVQVQHLLLVARGDVGEEPDGLLVDLLLAVVEEAGEVLQGALGAGVSGHGTSDEQYSTAKQKAKSRA